MRRPGIIVLCLIGVLPWLGAEAQRADRAQRLDRMDRVQDRIAARDRIADRVVTDRVRERPLTDITVREVDAEPVRETEPVDEPAESGADTRAVGIIIVDPYGDRIRRGEVLALNPSSDALAEIGRRNLRMVRERSLSGGAILYLFRSAGPANLTELLDTLRNIDPVGLYAPNHVFEPNGPPAPTASDSVFVAPPTNGEVCNVGLIDGPVQSLPASAQAVITQVQRFDPGPVSDSRHGAAVAHRLIDTAAQVDPSRSISICAADVFVAGPEEAITAEAIAAAMHWQMAQDVDLINASLAGPHNAIVAWTVEQFLESGGTLVAAVGNGGPLSRNIYPAAYDGVVGVTAVDDAGALYPLASQGNHVDIAARGVGIDITGIGMEAPISGTSFAAPVVSGWLFARNATLESLQLSVIDRGEPGRDFAFGYGELALTQNARLHFAAGIAAQD